MAMPRKRPLKNPEQPYVYVWLHKDRVIYAGFGKNNRCRPECRASLGGRSKELLNFLAVGRTAEIITILFPCKDRDTAKIWERRLIAELKPIFNTAPGCGGYSGMHSEEFLEKQRKLRTGVSLSKEIRAKMSRRLLGNTRLLGFKHTEETKKKISLSIRNQRKKS